MFNKKKIEELNKIIEYKNDEIKRLENRLLRKEERIHTLEIDLEHCKCAISTTPHDCTRGPWCAGCEFVKEVAVSHGGYISYIHLCGKAESCINFVQKKYDK